MGTSSPPASPDPAKSYEKEIQLNLQYLPQLLAAELASRQTQDPQYVQNQLNLQKTFGTQLYQQQLDNVGQFLGLQTPEEAISKITPVTPDRSNYYANPNAGFLGQQFAMQNYGNQLAGYNASNAAGNPWARALGGAASGAAAG